MSRAIRDISETLIELLRSKIGLSRASIDLLSPAEVTQGQSAADIRLGLSLYSIVPTADYRNESEIFGDPDRDEPRSPVLDLYYLLTAYPNNADADKNYAAQETLGAAMRVFFDNGLLTGSVLQGDLPRDQELRLTFQPMTVEDLTRIFGVFPDNALQTSVSYVVSPVKLLTKLRTEPLHRVEGRDAYMDAIAPITISA